ncbi:hypothetical protein DM01DRAFT_322926 [Hesseltinella vesiculosa]|uniref:Uncharacterized protein n=1 Tax=Hesseltinella vesiculosa TaxID=101127 RepID=A0A1X2G830_9FUNG|nr:hypothetical protein DM01DRAFT_322926 [Hesseltinella vesiculosa]
MLYSSVERKCKETEAEDPKSIPWLLKLRPSTSTKDTPSTRIMHTPLSTSAPLSTLMTNKKEPMASVSSSSSTAVPSTCSNSTTTNTPKKDEVVHLHYHYVLQDQKIPIDAMSSSISANSIPFSSTASLSSGSFCGTCQMDDIPCQHHSQHHYTIPSLPPPVAAARPPSRRHHPYSSTYTRACQLLDRLQGTDVRTLNRRLRQTFDMIQVASMSNTLLESILVDIGQLGDADDHVELDHNDVMVQLTQRMLKEIGDLRMIMNALQTDYVKKVMELEAWVEQDVRRKQLQQQSPPPSATASPSTASATSPPPSFAALSFLLLSPPPTRPKPLPNPSHSSSTLATPTIVKPSPSLSIPTIKASARRSIRGVSPSASLDHLLDHRKSALGYANWLTKNKEAHPFVMA